MEFVATCLFGLEKFVGEEIDRLGLSRISTIDGRVTFRGEPKDICRLNLNLRCAERIFILVGSFSTDTPNPFESLFEGTKSLPFEEYIGANDTFTVNGHSVKSRLTSIPACQGVVQKAIAARLASKYGKSWFDGDGCRYAVEFFLLNNEATLMIDTSGVALHKRGYRPESNAAPLRETLAAALCKLARPREDVLFWDPMCGSGTIPIEAALIARNAAPGGRRRFAAEAFAWCDGKVWDEVREEAKAKEFHGKYQILGSDNDPKCVSLAMANARKAGVGDILRFADGDATKMDLPAQSGILIGNPPYGQRMLEQQSAQRLYAALGRHLKYADGWKKFIITSEPEFEHYFGRRADKKRKLYNGMIKCDYYMYTDNSRKYQKRDDKK